MCFTVQLSKIGFALPFVSNSFAIISCRFLPVKNFFNFFWSCFVSLLQQLWYLITSNRLLSRTFFISFYNSLSDATRLCYHEFFQMSRTFFPFLSINAEGGIWTLARRKPSIPLAGAPLQPLEYCSISFFSCRSWRLLYNIMLYK